VYNMKLLAKGPGCHLNIAQLGPGFGTVWICENGNDRSGWH